MSLRRSGKVPFHHHEIRTWGKPTEGTLGTCGKTPPLLWRLCIFPESAEVPCKQPLRGLLRLSAQRGQSSGRASGQRQPDAHIQECGNHQPLNQFQPSRSPAPLPFTLILYCSCLLMRKTQHQWTVRKLMDELAERVKPHHDVEIKPVAVYVSAIRWKTQLTTKKFLVQIIFYLF